MIIVFSGYLCPTLLLLSDIRLLNVEYSGVNISFTRGVTQILTSKFSAVKSTSANHIYVIACDDDDDNDDDADADADDDADADADADADDDDDDDDDMTMTMTMMMMIQIYS